ncbi:transposase [Streptomyces smyrnaeus]|uniref:transposase n=1 Tax=Streptomyces smyrnaeus TaxID=1387713 RepID=UPI00367F0D3D
MEVIVHRYRTGIPWRDLPAGFGSWKSVWPTTAAGPATGPEMACSVSRRPARMTVG